MAVVRPFAFTDATTDTTSFRQGLNSGAIKNQQIISPVYSTSLDLPRSPGRVVLPPKIVSIGHRLQQYHDDRWGLVSILVNSYYQ